jgi:hypothetical protein
MADEAVLAALSWTGLSIGKIVKTLRPLRTATITLGGRQITVPPRIPDDTKRLLSMGHPGRGLALPGE